MNISQNLERSARDFPDNIAVMDDHVRLTYAQLDQWSGRIASGLASKGVGPGDFVAICLKNGAQWPAIYYGILKCGAVAVTLSTQLSREEFRLLMGHSEPKLIFTEENRLDQIPPYGSGKDRPTVIATGGDLDPATLESTGSGQFSSVDCAPDDTACILYTGGTTGLPKGVILTHENINTAILNVVRMERSAETDRALCFLPFNHVFGQMHILNATILSGGGLVLLPEFNMDRVFSAIKQHAVTKLYAVPTIYVRFLQVQGLKEKLCKVRYCFSAAASMASEMVNQWREITSLNIHEAYGMTETASMVTFNHYDHHVVGSVGVPAGDTEVKIVDASGKRLPPGQEGEICIRGRNVMKGYLNNPEATDGTIRDGWLHSGDVGYLDEHQYLHIVDRIKDMIITGGENVYPKEVEEVLYKRPEIMECAVIGLPDAEYGERVTACVVLKPGSSMDPVELKRYCKSCLSPYKAPKAFIPLPQLPTNPSGKILKRELRKMMVETQ
jgi:long-chain acyl-CoA synthetase